MNAERVTVIMPSVLPGSEGLVRVGELNLPTLFGDPTSTFFFKRSETLSLIVLQLKYSKQFVPRLELLPMVRPGGSLWTDGMITATLQRAYCMGGRQS